MPTDNRMKRIAILLLAMLPLLATAQVKIAKDANRFTYHQYDYGDVTDTTVVTVERVGDVITIFSSSAKVGEGDPKGGGVCRYIPGYCQTVTSVDYAADSITVTAAYDDTVYYYRTGFTRGDLEWRVEGDRHTCSVNSNTLMFVMDEKAPVNVTPLPYYGLNKGVLREYHRNGQLRLKLAKAEKVKLTEKTEGNRIRNNSDNSVRVSPRELDRIMKERLVVTTRIFDHEQICWGKENAHIDGDWTQMPFDTVLHFAGGTLILKRVLLPFLGAHYQHFVELHQQSNGDAYDRTGSVFVVLPGREKNFFDGINNHPDSLPIFIGHDGQRYQGVSITDGYYPLLELLRFFTPFGIGHFNDRMKDYGIEWRKETYYRQEITDVYDAMIQDVIIGVWIGNYDGGGHRLTMDIKSYPNSYTRYTPEEANLRMPEVTPLFNTCNVLEMAGQNYGKLFGTDSLTVTFTVPTSADGARLRYISTGHGGWDEGDEFVPKTNTILIDGKVAFTYTPWRQDCGCYRDLNPVSGNFWNGLSSSDYSRSGWCPGTATQPVYFDMTPWADGKEHTLTVAIPQGKPMEGMFSHWAVSGALIVEY